MKWNKIEFAPKNPEGTGFGPWILVFSDWDHGTYQARWEAHGEAAGWRFKGRKPGPWSSIENIKAWMELPQFYWKQEGWK